MRTREEILDSLARHTMPLQQIKPEHAVAVLQLEVLLDIREKLGGIANSVQDLVSRDENRIFADNDKFNGLTTLISSLAPRR